MILEVFINLNDSVILGNVKVQLRRQEAAHGFDFGLSVAVLKSKPECRAASTPCTCPRPCLVAPASQTDPH